MKATIVGENEDGIGVDIIDNNGAEHEITFEKETHEIAYHQSEAYADDPADRTPAENEYNEQARKFAQYYVYLEAGYDTVPPERHPERINAVRTAIASLDDDEVETLFGDLYRQLASHQDNAEPVLDVPADAAGPESVLYRQHVYLELDPLQTAFEDEAQELAARYGLDLSSDDVNDSETPADDVDAWRAFATEMGELAADAGTDLSSGLYIDGVSSLYLAYVDEAGHEHIGEPDVDPYDRAHDTLIELPPMEAGTLAEFRDYLDHNLACQVRDCFVRMGLQPPEPFQILGFGRFEAAEQYRKLDMYPSYIDPAEEKAFA